jgi:hypothetical protein
MTDANTQTAVVAESQTVSFRVEPETAERAEKLAEHMAELPAYAGIPLSKSRVYAMALLRGLDLLEQEHDLAKKKRR